MRICYGRFLTSVSEESEPLALIRGNGFGWFGFLDYSGELLRLGLFSFFRLTKKAERGNPGFSGRIFPFRAVLSTKKNGKNNAKRIFPRFPRHFS